MRDTLSLLVGLVSSFSLLEFVQGFPVLPPQQGRGVAELLASGSFASIPYKGRTLSLLAGKKGDWDGSEDDDDDDDDSYLLGGDQDWRDFRAKLVMSESKAASPSPKTSSEAVVADDGDLDGIGSIFQDTVPPPAPSSDEAFVSEAGVRMTPLDPSQWAYDSGKIIEQGAVILGGVEQEFGFGLRQQYFHKAAILVLDHEESTFTKGIILNRPTDLTLEDDINKGVKWRVWFGGDVQGLNSANPDIVCLHSLKSEEVERASIKVMKDIQWTSFENAKRLVKVGVAKPTDFWVFCGYAGWGPRQLMGELDRKSWYMVATDSQTLLKELGRQSAASDPREAGLDTWTLLMDMIGRSETAKKYSGDFDDLMLKEWALKNLLSSEAGGGAGEKNLPADATEGTGFNFSLEETVKPAKSDALDKLMSRVKGLSRGQRVTEGTLLRASPAERSPFLLEGQEFHKSVVLIINDDDGITVGAILNRPASKGLDVQIKDKNTGKSKTVKIPLRFGGQYAVKGTEPLLWLHCSASLRDAGIGSSIGPDDDGFFKCTADDVISSIGRGLAQPEDFIVVSGVSVWAKSSGGQTKGIQGEIDSGKFEIVPEGRVEWVWKALSKQDVLSSDNLSQNLEVATEAWTVGGKDGPKNGANSTKNGKANGKSEPPPMKGLGDGFDEEDDSLVFKSNVKVAKLSDDALRSWITTFLLGMSLDT